MYWAAKEGRFHHLSSHTLIQTPWENWKKKMQGQVKVTVWMRIERPSLRHLNKQFLVSLFFQISLVRFNPVMFCYFLARVSRFFNSEGCKTEIICWFGSLSVWTLWTLLDLFVLILEFGMLLWDFLPTSCMYIRCEIEYWKMKIGIVNLRLGLV